MTWQARLDEMVARTGHERYRWLCSDANPSRDLWRAEMIRMATAGPPAPLPVPVDYTPAVPSGRSCCG